jgi:hypothetical protein
MWRSLQNKPPWALEILDTMVRKAVWSIMKAGLGLILGNEFRAVGPVKTNRALEEL